MTRKLKTLGLALVALFSMSSVVASAASATNDLFEVEEAPLTMTGKQHNGNNKLNLAGQSVECTTISVNATAITSPVTEVKTQEPTYSGCTYAGQAATITPNGCRYVLMGATDANGHAQAKIECDAGKSISMTLTAAKCLITVAPQTSEEGYTVTTTGIGTTRELTLHLTLKAKVTAHAHPTEGITCASLTNGSTTLEGTFTITGEEDPSGPHIGITDKTE